jgi:hypothetical protein
MHVTWSRDKGPTSLLYFFFLNHEAFSYFFLNARQGYDAKSVMAFRVDTHSPLLYYYATTTLLLYKSTPSPDSLRQIIKGQENNLKKYPTSWPLACGSKQAK